MWKELVSSDVISFIESPHVSAVVSTKDLEDAKTTSDVYKALVDIKGLLEANEVESSVLDRAIFDMECEPGRVPAKRSAPDDILQCMSEDAAKRRKLFTPSFSSEWKEKPLVDFLRAVLSAARAINDTNIVVVHENGTVILETRHRNQVVQMVANIVNPTAKASPPYVVSVGTKSFYGAIAPDGAKSVDSLKLTHGAGDELVVDTQLTNKPGATHEHSLATGMAYGIPDDTDRIDQDALLTFDTTRGVKFSYEVFMVGLQAMVGEFFSITLDRNQLRMNSQSDGTRKTFNVPLIEGIELDGSPMTTTIRMAEVVNPLKRLEKVGIAAALRADSRHVEIRVTSGESWVSVVAAACIPEALD